MAIKKIQMKPEGANDYIDVVHPETSSDMIVGQGIWCIASGTNSYVADVVNVPSLFPGTRVTVKFGTTNTSTSTLNINNLGAKSIVKPGGAVPAPGSIKANGVYTLVYDGTSFQLQGEGGEYGTAQSKDILNGVTVGTGDGLITGTMPNHKKSVSVITEEGSSITIPMGYHSGTGTVNASITNLKSSNIKIGADVGGVVGTFKNHPIITPTSDNIVSPFVTELIGKVEYSGSGDLLAVAQSPNDNGTAVKFYRVNADGTHTLTHTVPNCPSNDSASPVSLSWFEDKFCYVIYDHPVMHKSYITKYYFDKELIYRAYATHVASTQSMTIGSVSPIGNNFFSYKRNVSHADINTVNPNGDILIGKREILTGHTVLSHSWSKDGKYCFFTAFDEASTVICKVFMYNSITEVTTSIVVDMDVEDSHITAYPIVINNVHYALIHGGRFNMILVSANGDKLTELGRTYIDATAEGGMSISNDGKYLGIATSERNVGSESCKVYQIKSLNKLIFDEVKFGASEDNSLSLSFNQFGERIAYGTRTSGVLVYDIGNSL